MDTRVDSLRRNIDFLQKQHRDTLEKLHGEIDSLKRQNKESSRIQRRHTESNKFQRDRNNYLEQTLEDTCTSQSTEISSSLNYRETRSNSSETLAADRTEGPSEARAGFITSLQPLMIQCSPFQAPRPPTLQECEVIIRQLYSANSLQSQEILRVKAVLKDIVFNKKITAENYILTKAFLGDGKRAEDSETFPQISFQTLPRGLPMSQASKAEKVILPALKQTLNNNIADRQRRTLAVRRRRLQRTMR
ncbi:hypothetical protein PO909_007965 [Leuciscus waleckii]